MIPKFKVLVDLGIKSLLGIKSFCVLVWQRMGQEMERNRKMEARRRIPKT